MSDETTIFLVVPKGGGQVYVFETKEEAELHDANTAARVRIYPVAARKVKS
jgi:hypothetical protein